MSQIVEQSIPHNTPLDFEDILSKLPKNRNILKKLANQINTIVNTLCPECNEGIVRQHQRELVCEKCGLVVKQVTQSQNRIPGFGSDNPYEPSVSLLLGRNGSEVNGGKVKDYATILKANHEIRGEKISGDLVQKAAHALSVQSMLVYNIERGIREPNKYVAKMLMEATELSKQYGTRYNPVFGEGLGDLIRKIGCAIQNLGNTQSSEYWARVIFLFYFKQMREISKKSEREMLKELKVRKTDLKAVAWLLQKSILAPHALKR